MSAAISKRTRKNLSQSLSLVDLHKENLVNRMEASLRAGEPDDEAYGQSEMVAIVLVDLLLAQARNLVNSGELADLRDVDAEHRALMIAGRHYSRFGDALVPILKDLLGSNLPSGVTAAWCGTFWTVIRAARDRPQPAQARREMAHA
jgi:hemoglobin-like flavoprotein